MNRMHTKIAVDETAVNLPVNQKAYVRADCAPCVVLNVLDSVTK